MDYLPIQTTLTDEICEKESQPNKQDTQSSKNKNSLHYLFFSKVDNSKNFSNQNRSEEVGKVNGNEIRSRRLFRLYRSR